jgi:hypothetical protein
MIYYLAFGPLYRFPRNVQEDSISYGYTLNTKEFCEKIATKDSCKGAKNPEKCQETLLDLDLCIENTNVWLHSLNEKCFEEINTLEMCIDKKETCTTQINILYKCESDIARPEWIHNEFFDHWKHVEKQEYRTK